MTDKALTNFSQIWCLLYNQSTQLFKVRLSDFITKQHAQFLFQFNPNFTIKKRASTVDEKPESQFNFMKVEHEINMLMWRLLVNGGKQEPPQQMKSMSQVDTSEQDFSVLKVNVNPLVQTQSLYIPHIKQLLPQDTNRPDLLRELVALFRCQWLGPGIFIGYNSKGGLASVNHLHYHVCSKDEIFKNQGKLLVETIKPNSEPLFDNGTFQLYTVTHLYCHAFYLQLNSHFEQLVLNEAKLDCCIDFIHRIIECLQTNCVEYNLVFMNQSVLIVPRKHKTAILDPTFVTPACIEFATGIFNTQRQDIIDTLQTEQVCKDLERVMRQEVCLDDKEMEQLLIALNKNVF